MSSRQRRLSTAQARWLRLLAKGEDPRDYLHGESEHGGATGTVASLARRGYIDRDGAITEQGRQAILQHNTNQSPSDAIDRAVAAALAALRSRKQCP